MNKLLSVYGLLLFGASFLGAQVLAIDLGFFQLSLYRILLVFSPIVLFQLISFKRLKYFAISNRTYLVFFTIWILYSLFSIFWVKDFRSFFLSFAFLFTGYISTWLIGLTFTKDSIFKKALFVVEFFSIAIIILSAYEISTGNYIFLNEENKIFYDEKSLILSSVGLRTPITIFGNPNNLALYLIFGISISTSLATLKKTNFGKLISVFVCLALIFDIYLTQSRSGFIGVFIFYFFIYFLNFTWKKFIYILFFIVLVMFSIIPFIISNFDLFRDILGFDSSTGSDYIRINLIKNGFYFLYESYFLGVGMGNIEFYMSNYRIYDIGDIRNIHNWWMEVLVSSGAVIFLFYVFIYLRLIKILISISKTTSELNYFKSILSRNFSGFLISFSIVSVGASSVINIEWVWPAMALIIFSTKLKTN